MLKVRLTIETIGAKGIRDLSTQEFDKRQVIFGRGVDADLRLHGQFVSLAHAVLFQRGETFFIEDKGSPGGTLVNGVPTKRIQLNVGDLISIGDYKITVINTSDFLELRLVIDRSQTIDLKSQIESDLKVVDSAARLRWMRPLSYLLIAASVAVFLVWPSLEKSKAIWSPGELSMSHRMLENSCESCHQANFRQVPDQQCLQCHELTTHSTGEKKEAQPNCIECHFEHRGAFGLLLKPSAECSHCHDINGFDVHPNFDVRRDTSSLKFSHEMHLSKSLLTDDGRKRLDCIDCHQTDESRESMISYKFQKNCQSCHHLNFDEAFIDIEVPHRKPQLVFEFLMKIYREKGIPFYFQANAPEIPGRPTKPKSKPNSSLEATRRAEKYLFEEGPCFQCHEVKRKEFPSVSGSHYEIQEMSETGNWLKNSYAMHSTHEAFSCLRCHSAAALSTSSQENLSPRVSDCQECHTSRNSVNLIPSPCSLCHTYHQSLKLNPEKQRRKGEDE